MREQFEDTDFSDVEWMQAEPASRQVQPKTSWTGSVVLCLALAVAFMLVLRMG